MTRATLYAYVSRGYVRSEARPGTARERRYSREDVERLRRRNEERRDPEKAAGRALQWHDSVGITVLMSIVASFMPINRVARVEPATVFRA